MPDDSRDPSEVSRISDSVSGREAKNRDKETNKERMLREKRRDTETEKGNMAVKSNCSYFPLTKRTTKNKSRVPRLCYGCAGGPGKGKRSAGSGGVLLISD